MSREDGVGLRVLSSPYIYAFSPPPPPPPPPIMRIFYSLEESTPKTVKPEKYKVVCAKP